MWPAVRTVFPEWSTQFEGRLPYMYLDRRKDEAGNPAPVVTTGIGNALFSIGASLVLPWKRRNDGSAATSLEIATAYQAVEARKDLAEKGGRAFADVTSIYLDDDAIDHLVDAKLSSNELVLVSRFPDFAQWPADAQLGALSMAWMMGPRFAFPKFAAAAREGEFETCAVECFVPHADPLRNNANEHLFLSAARVLDAGLPRDRFLDGAMPITPQKSPIDRTSPGGGGKGAAVVAFLAVLGGALYYALRGG